MGRKLAALIFQFLLPGSVFCQCLAFSYYFQFLCHFNFLEMKLSCQFLTYMEGTKLRLGKESLPISSASSLCHSLLYGL
jgi:hypothetical protein